MYGSTTGSSYYILLRQISEIFLMMLEIEEWALMFRLHKELCPYKREKFDKLLTQVNYVLFYSRQPILDSVNAEIFPMMLEIEGWALMFCLHNELCPYKRGKFDKFLAWLRNNKHTRMLPSEPLLLLQKAKNQGFVNFAFSSPRNLS